MRLGMSIQSALSPESGVLVNEIVPGGQAEHIGMKVGMQLLTLNGKDVRGFTLASNLTSCMRRPVCCTG